MQTTSVPSDLQPTPPPAEAKPANGAGNPEHLAALPATELLHQNEEITRKLASIETLGRQVIAKGGEVSKQETKCAEIKADLDSERDKLHKLERERDELQEELTLLATGRASERLPFKEPAESKDAKPAANAPADADAWKSVMIELLGIKSKRVLAALHDHVPPIVTHGDLAAWQEKKADFWAKDIKGLGAKGREEIENAQAAYWQANPQPKATEAAKPGESFDDAAILDDSIKTIVDNPSKALILNIQIAQRANGTWVHKYICSIAGVKGEGRVSTKEHFVGKYPSREHAIGEALLLCHGFANTVLESKPKKVAREAAKEVQRIIDRIDKQLDAKGLPDPKAQAEADVKNVEKDNAAKRGRKGK